MSDVYTLSPFQQSVLVDALERAAVRVDTEAHPASFADALSEAHDRRQAALSLLSLVREGRAVRAVNQ
jgi:hypothetical protein